LVRLPDGLLKSAQYIRSHAAPTDVVWEETEELWAVTTGLTDRISFTSLETFFATQTGRLSELIAFRRSISNELRRASLTEQFAAIARAARIDWCLLTPEGHQSDDVAGKVEFTEAGYRVVRVSAAPR
jgi:hypothetical protein